MPDEPIRKRRGPSKPGGGKRKNRDARKEARREAAQKRQAEYDALSDREKLARALERGGEGSYEAIRLRNRGVFAA